MFKNNNNLKLINNGNIKIKKKDYIIKNNTIGTILDNNEILTLERAIEELQKNFKNDKIKKN